MNETVKLKKKDIILTGLFKENSVFKMTLGLCPALAISDKFENAFGMGIMVIVVLMLTNGIISLIRNFIDEDIRIPAFIVIIATVVTMIGMFIDAFAPALATSLGIFIPLITVNCIVLGRAEAFARKNTFVDSILDGLGAALGFMLAIVLIAIFREILGTGTLTIGKLLPLGFEVTLKIFNPNYAIKMLVEPMGAFLVIGLLLAGFVAYDNNKKYRMRIRRAKR
ncbi:MAG: electron transport complex subunit RsxE [Acholeplasmataceae bacterium]|jgi:electron transport complex protein RnfE|nr:electron transport complex subunit RsxE [Acholeplasmataceae bacterium]